MSEDSKEKDWRKKYPEATVRIQIEDKCCYLKKLDRTTLEVVLGIVQPSAGVKPKLIEAGEIILNTCWIAGDPELKSKEEKNEGYLVAAAMEAYNLIEFKQSTLEKR